MTIRINKQEILEEVEVIKPMKNIDINSKLYQTAYEKATERVDKPTSHYIASGIGGTIGAGLGLFAQHAIDDANDSDPHLKKYLVTSGLGLGAGAKLGSGLSKVFDRQGHKDYNNALHDKTLKIIDSDKRRLEKRRLAKQAKQEQQG